jgi:hypothetical protein
MARAFTKKTKAEQSRRHTLSSEASHESTCARCGGLMVTDFYMDLLFCIGETECTAKRCVQCGEIIDSVILCNRGITHDPATAQPPGKVATNNRVTNVRGDSRGKPIGQAFAVHEVPRAGPAEVDDRRGNAMQPDHRVRKTEQVSFSHRGRRRESARRLPLR